MRSVGIILLIILSSASVLPQAWGESEPSPQELLERFRAERDEAVHAKFPPEALARADELAARGEAALRANNPTAAARYLRDARWQLPFLPPGLPEHVVRVLGESRLRHADRVNALAFSPDLARLASCSKDGTVRVWDLGNGREVAVYRGHSDQPADPTRATTNVLGVSDVAFQPSDPKVIASASGNQVHLWNADTGKFIRTLVSLGKTDKPIKSIAFSPDGKLLAVGADDGIVRVVRLEDGQVTFTSPGRNARIEKVAFHPSGDWIAVADSNSQVAVFATSRPNPLIVSVPGVDAGEVLGVAFTSDGAALIAGGRDGKSRMIALPKPDGPPAANPPTRLREYIGHERAVTGLALLGRDGLVTAGEDMTVRVWDLTSARQLRQFQGHLTRVTAVAARPDGKQIASASEDGVIRVWDLTDQDDHRVITDAADSLWAVVFSPNGRRVATAGADRFVRVYDPQTGRAEAAWEAARSPITSLAFLPDSNRLAVAGGDRVIGLWDVDKRQLLRQCEGHTSAVLSLAVSADGKWLVSGAADRTTRGFDLETGKLLWTWNGRSAVCTVAVRAGNKQVAVGLADGTLAVLDVSTGSPRELQAQAAHMAGVAAVAYSSTGTQLASVGGDGSLRIWTVGEDGTLAPLVRFDVRSRPGSPAAPLTGVAFSPDARFVAAVGAEPLVRLWDIQSKSEVRSFRGHTDWVTAVAFSPDGRLLASVAVDKDRSLRLFDLPSLDLASGGGHLSAVNAVAVSPDGKRVATAATDQTVKVWDLASGRELKTLVGNADTPFAVAFLGDEIVVVGGSLPTREAGRLHLWSVPAARLTRSVPTGEVYAAWAAPGGTRLAVWASRPAVGEAVKNNSYELYDPKGNLLASVSDKGRNVRAVAFSHDAQWAVAGDDQGTVRIWDIEKKERIGADWPLFAGSVGDVGITPDRSRLVAVDDKGVVKVANVASREVITSFPAHPAGVRSVLVSPTGSTFVTVSNEREVRAWSLATEQLKNPQPVRAWVLPVAVNALAYTPDGKFVVTGNADGTAYVLELPVDKK